jgi:hypothetical protein
MRPIEQKVLVTPGGRRKARMKRLVDFLRPLDAGTGTQQRIDATGPGTDWPHHVNVKMDHLAAGMDAGIGTAGADSFHAVPGDFAQGVFECVLDTATAGLRLPSAKPDTIVFEPERNAHKTVSGSSRFVSG